MCLAVPGRIITVSGNDAIVDFQGNRARVCTVVTPDAREGDWVLVHAGFAITELDKASAEETWAYLSQIKRTEIDEAIGCEEGNDAF